MAAVESLQYQNISTLKCLVMGFGVIQHRLDGPCAQQYHILHQAPHITDSIVLNNIDICPLSEHITVVKQLAA